MDTSAFLAVLDSGDRHHRRAKAEWTRLISGGSVLFTTNYILVETFALLQSRFGMDAARVFNEDVLPLLNVIWVDEVIHNSAVNAMQTAARRRLSLVDCVSFETMRRLGIKTVFAFDSHFKEQGFDCVP